MIEHDAVAGAKAVALPIVDGRPVRENLGYTVRTARPKRRLLGLRNFAARYQTFRCSTPEETGNAIRLRELPPGCGWYPHP